MNLGYRGPRLLALLLPVAVAACSRESSSPEATQQASPPSAEASPSREITTPWCGEGWRALDSATCLALPERFAAPPSVVIHVHGALAPDALPTEEQATLLAAARTHGFAVLFSRGKAGLCKWEAKVADHLCWPTTQRDVDDLGPEIYAAWRDARGRAEDVAGTRFERTYLFGFSNGGYFTAFTSVEGRFPIDGAGVVGAGRTAVDESRMGSARPPVYIAVGGAEESTTQRDGYTLSQVLTAHDWPVQYVVHGGRGHELREDDLAAAWVTWGRGEEREER